VDQAAEDIAAVDLLGGWRFRHAPVCQQLGRVRHGRLQARLRPMRGLEQDRSAGVTIAGHASVQRFRRGDYELVVDEPTSRRVAVAFDELVVPIWSQQRLAFSLPWVGATQQRRIGSSGDAGLPEEAFRVSVGLSALGGACRTDGYCVSQPSAWVRGSA
jgi:hypothetical protein